MPINPLFKKLGIKPGQKILLKNTPIEIESQLIPFPENVSISKNLKGTFDLIIIFAYKKAEVMQSASLVIKILAKEGILWLAYPKKTSGIDTELNRDKAWDSFTEFGYRPVNLISLNENWSSMRFKRNEDVSTKHSKEQNSHEYIKHIDLKNKIVSAPEDLVIEFKKNKNSKEFFESLAYSHKKEYIAWILSAKKGETRALRVQKTIEKLKGKKKNPTEK